MADRDLILGVLAAQAGFVTPSQVMAAAAARMVARDERTVLDHLMSSGALKVEQRDMVLALADAALKASGGDSDRVLATIDGARDLSRTLAATLSSDPQKGTRVGEDAETEDVAVEREGQYVRLDELGRGGQSIVWRARDRFMRREVALKELTPPREGESPATASAARSRFVREARLTAQLDHPGIVAVHDLVERPDGTLFCAQKLIRGRTLKVALARCRTLRERLDLLPHVVDAAQAVAYAHAHGVVHRDLKPSNVMVGEYGETVVVDWGLAKHRSEPDLTPGIPTLALRSDLTQAGVALGTPAYMSPEQARGDLDAIDERTDVFGLGAMLYEVLTGAPPFEGADNQQLIEAVLAGRFVPVRVRSPAAPPELAAIAERALQSAPAQRYPDAAAMAGDLLAYRAGRRVGAYTYGALELLRKFIVRNPALSAATGAALLILVASAIVVVVQLRQAKLNLAAALVERAHRAEDVSDWARAAAYYAASRLEHDTTAARWGVALARERLPQRKSVLEGPPGAFTDVDVLDDGTVLALEARGNSARLYEPTTGRTLWKVDLDGSIKSAEIRNRTVRAIVREHPKVFDELTGSERFPADGMREALCGGNSTTQGTAVRPGDLVVGGVRLGPSVHLCAISRDGERLATLDRAGVVRLFELREGREITSRPVPDAQALGFTAHGLAVVRSASLQIFGGPEGDFSVEVPGRLASAFASEFDSRAVAVSPDGHRVVVDSPTLNRADVVDLRERAVFVSVSRPSGEPNYTFSHDGAELYAAGLLGGRTLISWALLRPLPLANNSAKSRLYLRLARSRFLFLEVRQGLELRAEDGTLLRKTDDPEVLDVALSADGSTLAISRPHQVVVQHAESGQELASVPCELCRIVRLSADGSRLFGVSSEALRIWDVRRMSLLRELKGLTNPFRTPMISPAGDRFGWSDSDRYVLEEVSSGARSELSLTDAPSWASISPDGSRLALEGAGILGVWRVPGLEPVWTAPNPSSGGATVAWSNDGSILSVAREGAGALLLDGQTGAPLARITEARSGGAAAQINVLPSLKYRLARAARSWTLTRLPPPDTSSPAESLRRALAEGGFRLRGVELEDAAP